MVVTRVSILLVFVSIFFIHNTFFSYANKLTTPNSPIENLPVYNKYLYPEPSTPKPRKWVTFGWGNTIATGLILVITLLNIIVYKLREIQESNLDEELNLPSSLPSERSCRRFSLAEILLATHNFRDELVLGRGGFGKVYKGVIDNGTVTVAIKRLNHMSKQGSREFWNEIEMLSKFRHSHLVSLIGYCNVGKEKIIVYEYMVNGTLADHLHKKGKNGSSGNSTLSWVQRLKICIGAAHELDYLHTGTGVIDRVIHRDVKSSNILLDANFAARISDFGMSKIGPANTTITNVSTNVKGTFGPVIDLRVDDEQKGLAGWAQQNVREGTLDQIIDRSLSGQILPDSLKTFAQIADQCLHMFSKNRPTMAEVVVSLELALALQERVEYSFDFGEFLTENQENSDSPLENEGIANLQNDLQQQDQMGEIIQPGDARNEHPHAKSIKKTVLTRILQQAFTARVISGHSDPKKSSKNSKSSIKKVRKNKAFPSKDVHVAPGALPSGQITTSFLGEVFTYQQIRQATGEFNNINLLKNGHSGDLFRGILEGGVPVVIKGIDLGSVKKEPYMLELDAFNKVSHSRFVPLLGHCMENENEKFLIYKYMPNGDLSSSLFRKTNFEDDTLSSLDWITRLKIAIGVAEGLSYLHHECTPPLVHSDVQASSILLDEKFEVRLGSLSGVCAQEEDAHQIRITNLLRLPQSSKQSAPVTPALTCAHDVYCFGKVLLELVTGELGISASTDGTRKEWLEQTIHCISISDKELVTKIVDPSLLIDEDLLEEVWAMAVLAKSCLNPKPSRRPLMKYILKALENPVMVVREEDISSTTNSARLSINSSLIEEDSFSF
ncbi:hypothetical protein LguiA_030867 [Lonicera macranthoides]